MYELCRGLQAAQHLGDAISRKVRLLEQHVGLTFFLRGHRSIELTPQGREFLGRNRPALDLIRDAADDALRTSQNRPVTLAATNYVAALWLTPRPTLDVDSLPIEAHGHQPKAEWNGHYRSRAYHPLITSVAETGDMLDARLRSGNVGTAEGALDVTPRRRGPL